MLIMAHPNWQKNVQFVELPDLIRQVQSAIKDAKKTCIFQPKAALYCLPHLGAPDVSWQQQFLA